jgi:hydrogenase maturation protease
MPRILVAGIGNIFLGDDGFGVEVVRRLSAQTPRADIDVVDFGIRGVHLAYELSGGKYDAAILVDATPRGGEPGTLYTIEADPAETSEEAGDAHNMTPAAVLDWVRRTGGRCGRVLVVGCEPESLVESMGLSEAVALSVEPAMDMVCRLAAHLRECESCA